MTRNWPESLYIQSTEASRSPSLPPAAGAAAVKSGEIHICPDHSLQQCLCHSNKRPPQWHLHIYRIIFKRPWNNIYMLIKLYVGNQEKSRWFTNKRKEKLYKTGRESTINVTVFPCHSRQGLPESYIFLIWLSKSSKYGCFRAILPEIRLAGS